MRIITTTCDDCGTVIAGNVLERNRAFTCPGLDCRNIHYFDDLPPEDRTHLEENVDQYRL